MSIIPGRVIAIFFLFFLIFAFFSATENFQKIRFKFYEYIWGPSMLDTLFFLFTGGRLRFFQKVEKWSGKLRKFPVLGPRAEVQRPFWDIILLGRIGPYAAHGFRLALEYFSKVAYSSKLYRF